MLIAFYKRDAPDAEEATISSEIWNEKEKKQQTKTEFDEVRHFLSSPYVMGVAA